MSSIGTSRVRVSDVKATSTPSTTIHTSTVRELVLDVSNTVARIVARPEPVTTHRESSDEIMLGGIAAHPVGVKREVSH
ncbi:hypothetical protein [Gordonia sp. MP11Mi]|uniref:Uncharacterized protein n=1 Tax=Gordonia sp. MP11Mi TaxID=3022769 RepID=A0AA97GTX6_9ACTN